MRFTFATLLIILLLPLGFAQVLFEADWGTGLGTGIDAVMDTDKVRPFTELNGLASVNSDSCPSFTVYNTQAEGRDFPTENFLRLKAFDECPGLGGVGDGWNQLGFRANANYIPVLQDGESVFVRYYIRVLYPYQDLDTGLHGDEWFDWPFPVGIGYGMSDTGWQFSFHGLDQPAQGSFCIGAWQEHLLDKHKTYRIEHGVIRNGDNFQIRGRIYDEQISLTDPIYNSSDFDGRCWGGTIVGTTILDHEWPAEPLTWDVHARQFRIGLNGITDLTPQNDGQDVFEWAALAVCLNDWCGPYQQPQQGICEATSGTCYYVDPNVASDGAGTFDDPFRTPQLAVNTAQPSDVIYLRGGTYDLSHAYPSRTQNWNSPSEIYYRMLNIKSTSFPGWASAITGVSSYNVNDGTASNPITVKAYPGETPFFDGYGVSIRDKSHWIIDGFEIERDNIHLGGGDTHDIYIRNNRVGYYAVESLTTGGQPNVGSIKIDRGWGGPYNIFVHGNTIHDLYDTRTNDWENAPRSHWGAITTLSSEVYDGYDVGGTGYIEIINNTIYNVPAAFFLKNPMYGPVKIHGNVVHDIQQIGYMSASNVDMQRNLIYNTPRGWVGVGGTPNADPRITAIFGQNATAKFNTIVGPDGFMSIGSSVGHEITNNVFFGMNGRVTGLGTNNGWDEPSYILKGENSGDDPDPANSELHQVTSENNCFITGANSQDMQHTFRRVGFMDHYSFSEAQQTFNFDLNSVLLEEPNQANVFDSNFDLIGQAATLCDFAGYTSTGWTPPVCIPQQEICDGQDNDCDGQVDEDNVCAPPPSGPTITVDSTFSGYSTLPINDDVIDAAGGTATTWASSDASAPHWIQLDFSQPTELSSFIIHWAYNNFLSLTMTSQEVQAQYWDGSNWQTAGTFTRTSDETSSRINLIGGSSSRWRLYQPTSMGHPDYTNIFWITELDYTVGTVTPVPGDVDGDGDVDIFDLLIVVTDIGKNSGFDARADRNGDNEINLFDLVLVAKNWGRTQVVPLFDETWEYNNIDEVVSLPGVGYNHNHPNPNDGGSYIEVVDNLAGTPWGGTHALRRVMNKSEWAGIDVVLASLPSYQDSDEIWVEFWLRNGPNWVPGGSADMKTMFFGRTEGRELRFQIQASSDGIAMRSYGPPDTREWFCDPVEDGGWWGGQCQNKITATSVFDNQWHNYKFYIKSGVGDGTWKAWVDDVQMLGHSPGQMDFGNSVESYFTNVEYGVVTSSADFYPASQYLGPMKIWQEDPGWS